MRKQAKPQTPKKKPVRPAPEVDRASKAQDPAVCDPPFPVVGIGASAGGLAALSSFLKNVVPGSGMAFVIVQHLDPARKGIIVELLQRVTAMPVLQIKDRMTVKPDHVYVIPPNRDLSLLHGDLHLLEPTSRRGLRLPIDFFFRSLAQDLQHKGIGVILSGMGSDGTLGLRMIKENAGAGFVQSPESAEFDGMPRSAIDAGLADVIAPVEELPSRIVAYLKHLTRKEPVKGALENKTQSGLEKIFILLRARTGHDFSLYKKSTLYRRIERRMAIHQIDSIATYVRYLQETPMETELLFKELLIGVTSFFRDAEAWNYLRDNIIPDLLLNRRAPPIRAWAAGCSTGEEAYSLAICFKEAMEKIPAGRQVPIQIFATDMDRDAVDKARLGVYPANIVADVPARRLQRFFVQEDRGYRISMEIREMVIFATQNLIMNPPFTRLDILICRNLLIYLTPEIQKKLIPLFHYNLNPRGILFLGTSETVGLFTDLFKPLAGKTGLYRRNDTATDGRPVEFPLSFSAVQPEATAGPDLKKTAPNIPMLADQLLLATFAPAAVLTSDKGDIIYISGRTGKYLEPAAGKANWNIFAMAREGLRHELKTAFNQALHRKNTVRLKGLQVRNNEGRQALNVSVQAIAEPEALRGKVLIVFTEVDAPAEKIPSSQKSKTAGRNATAVKLAQELEKVRQELSITRTEMQTSQEELQSANEELQSANEELQSTNEELTTSREEMQSMNEELQTLNSELQTKVDELSWTASDMKNLLESADVAILFLDDKLKVRRFTSRTARIFKLIAGDVGRPITDITSRLIYPNMADDARKVMETLVGSEKTLNTGDGDWFIVRIIPYRTLENRITGVVVTFADVTASKTLEDHLRKTQSALEAQVEQQKTALTLSEDRLQTERKKNKAKKTMPQQAGLRKKGETGHDK